MKWAGSRGGNFAGNGCQPCAERGPVAPWKSKFPRRSSRSVARRSRFAATPPMCDMMPHSAEARVRVRRFELGSVVDRNGAGSNSGSGNTEGWSSQCCATWPLIVYVYPHGCEQLAQNARGDGAVECRGFGCGRLPVHAAWQGHSGSCGLHAVAARPGGQLHRGGGDRPALWLAGVHAEGTGQAAPGQGRGLAPAFDGVHRSPVPRFTVLSPANQEQVAAFFRDWAVLLPVLAPGANVVVAASPLLSHLVAGALAAVGLERRGEIVRLVTTMRGGDRPKGAHEEFREVGAMPRSMREPWLVFRKPLQGRVQDNLRKWRCGGFRRPAGDKPFGDVIRSAPPASRRGRWRRTRI